MRPKKNSQRALGFTTGVARMLMKLFYACYRLGVNHAAEEQDEGLCRAHIEKTRQPGVFGTILSEYANSDLFWQLELEKLAIEGGFSNAFTLYRRNAGAIYRNYYSVAYEIAQDFYNAGLKDYCDAPSAVDIQAFNHCDLHNRVKWSRHGIKAWKMERWVSDAQMFALQRQHLSARSDAKLKATDKHYTFFIRGIKNASAVSFDSMT